MLSIVLSGCTEETALDELFGTGNDNYITVNVVAYATVVVQDLNGRYQSPDQLSIQIRIVKAGGETESAIKTANANGITDSVSASFKLYREQNIECIASIVTEQYGERYQSASAYEVLLWDDVYPAIDFGGSYGWPVNLQLTLTDTWSDAMKELANNTWNKIPIE